MQHTQRNFGMRVQASLARRSCRRTVQTQINSFKFSQAFFSITHTVRVQMTVRQVHFTRPESRMIRLPYTDGLDTEHAILKLHFGHGMLTSVLAATWRIFPEASDHRLTELGNKKAITKAALKWQRTLETYVHTHAIVTAMCTFGLHYIFASFLKQILTNTWTYGRTRGAKGSLTRKQRYFDKKFTTWRSWIRASWYNYENNQQDALYRCIYYSKSPLHVSGDVFAHHQEHLTVFTVSGSVHPSCCLLVPRMSWNWTMYIVRRVQAHHQEHLIVFTVSGSVHPSCFLLVSRMSWNWTM